VSQVSGRRGEALAALNRELQRSSDNAVLFNLAVAARVGVHPTDLKVLGLLAQDGAMTAGRLAKRTGLTTGAITFSIDRLERAGYARRARHPRDRRSVLVEPLMERAMRDLGPYFDPVARAMADLGARYTDEQLAVILDFITRTNHAMRREIAGLRGEAPPTEEPGAD